MRTLFLICVVSLLLSFHANGQKKKDLVEFVGGYSSFNNDLGASAIGEVKLSVPAGQFLALGIGAAFLKPSNLKKFYMPIFLNICPILSRNKSKPVVYAVLHPGVGVYNSEYTYRPLHVTTTGGFYFGGGLGCWLPSKKGLHVNLQAKYNKVYLVSRSTFDGTTDGRRKEIHHFDGFSIMLGVAI